LTEELSLHFPKMTRMPLTSEVPLPSNKSVTRNKFTAEENNLICRLVEQYGANHWDQITAIFVAELRTNRTRRQLRERWVNYLNPELDLGSTEAEDELLCALVREHGQQWAKIATLMGRKSSTWTRNRYRLLETLRTRGQRPSYTNQPPQVIAQENVGIDGLEVGEFDQQTACDFEEFGF
jgi:hypothetical protein